MTLPGGGRVSRLALWIRVAVTTRTAAEGSRLHDSLETLLRHRRVLSEYYSAASVLGYQDDAERLLAALAPLALVCG